MFSRLLRTDITFDVPLSFLYGLEQAGAPATKTALQIEPASTRSVQTPARVLAQRALSAKSEDTSLLAPRAPKVFLFTLQCTVPREIESSF